MQENIFKKSVGNIQKISNKESTNSYFRVNMIKSCERELVSEREKDRQAETERDKEK